MNYSNLYTNTQRRLTDALLSMWASGKEEEQTYLRYVLEEKEPLLASPVFRTVFPWKSSEHTFGDHASRLGILDKDFVESLSNADENFCFPLDRHPYSHQTESWNNMLNRKKTIVVTSGTGSGKTECFMIPVLQDLLREKKAGRGKGVQAIFLYPLNALMDSQKKRIHAWCEALSPQVSYAIFNGNTPNEMNSVTEKASFPEITCRESVRSNPPQILFTNPTMLEYMLLRNSDQAILTQSKGTLRWILLDETHSYSGSSAAELALQLRRVLDAFGVTIDQVNFAATSATIGENPRELVKFVSRLTGKKTEDIEIVNGERVIPEMDEAALQNDVDAINKEFGTGFTPRDAHLLRDRLNSNPALSMDEIAETAGLTTDSIEQKLTLIDRLGDKAILPTQGHFFARSIGGMYACPNPDCTIDKDKRLSIGSLTTKPATECSCCGSKLLEVAICNSCGELLLNGEFNESTHKYRMATNSSAVDTSLFELGNELDMDEEEDEDGNKIRVNKNGWTSMYLTKGCQMAPHNKAFINPRGLSFQKKDKFTYAYGENGFDYCAHKDNFQPLCPRCGESAAYAIYARTSSALISRMLSSTLLEEAQPMENTGKNTVYEGRKFIAFTDSRQGTAKSALAQNIMTERNWTRTSVFHYLSDRARGNASKGLTADEEASYKYMSDLFKTGMLPPPLQGMLKQLESKKKLESVTDYQPISLSAIVSGLEEDGELKKLFTHLSEARKNEIKKGDDKTTEVREDRRDYLKALLLDALGMRPRRGNSLETMGLVSLYYPGIAKEKAPQLFTKYGFTDKDWRDFLKICLDYHIRRNMHYVIPGRANVYLPQSYFSDFIYQPELPAGTKKDSRSNISLKRWPHLLRLGNIVHDKQSRLVLLLCAAIDITDINSMSEDQKDDIDEILRKAWRMLEAKVLTAGDERTVGGVKYKGYKLDLFDDRKVQIKLTGESWVCPVHNSLVDVNFKSFSPLLTGYVNADTFNRFNITTPTVSLSNFPYAFGKNDEGKTVDKNEVREWMDEAFHNRKERGIWSDIYENILLKNPVFIAAEHSAQLQRKALERYEKQFNNGEINILSCSTTMEMGIDIGGISEVLMANVPPKPANYLQRAGRAGRRGEMKSLSFTICAPTPVGTNTFNNPTWALNHEIAMPLIRMESHILVQRNVNSYLLSQYIARRGGMEIKESIKDFFYENGGKHFADFRVFLEGVASNDKIAEGYNRLIKGTVIENTPLEKMAGECLKQIISIYGNLDSKVKMIEQNLADVKSGNRKKLFEHQLNKLLKENLIGFLAEHNFIPSAGIPTGLIEFENLANTLSRHLSVAISEYAPGNRIVANEWAYESAGIELKGKWSESRRSHLQNCPSCGYSTIRIGKHLESCPYCGPGQRLQGAKGFLEMKPFTETIEPAGFKTDISYKPTRKMKQNPLPMVYPVLLEMEPWVGGESNILNLRTGTPQAEILYYNLGDGKGYALCTVCGKMKKEKDMREEKPLENQLANHLHLSTGSICSGNDDRATQVRRNVLLVGRYQTDLVEMRFRDKDGNPLQGSALYSLGVVLTNKLADYIGVNRSEIKFGVNEQFNSVFIFDTALGGAGYSTLFPLYRDKVLDMAYEELSKCDCAKACTRCLIDRDSQWFMEKLDRLEALEWLEFERESRREIPGVVKSVVPDVQRVTANLRAEFSNILTDPSLEEVTVFVSNDLSTWTPSEWPFAKSLASLQARGVHVRFMMPRKDIRINELSGSDFSLLLETKIKYSLGFISGEPNGIYVLLSARFTDGKIINYLSDSDVRPYNGEWSSDTVVYKAKHISGISCVEWNPDFESSFADSSRIMLNFKITTPRVRLGAFAEELFSHDREQWEKIKQRVTESSVSVKYTDRYVKTPLGCLMLVRLIQQLVGAFNLSVQDFELNLAFPAGKAKNYNSELSNEFDYPDERDGFISECAENLLGVTPKINGGYLPHFRELWIGNDAFELVILPDGGIENGWGIDREYERVRIGDVRDDWGVDLKLYSKVRGMSGIMYTVVFGRNYLT